MNKKVKALIDPIRKELKGDQHKLMLRLQSVYEGRKWEQAGYVSFNAFVEDIEGLGNRKAIYMAKGIPDDIRRLGYSRKDIREFMDCVGWTKVQIILTGLPKRRSISELVKVCAGKTAVELNGQFVSVKPRTKTKKTDQGSFTATLSTTRMNRLYRLLEKNHGLPKGQRKHQGVGRAFGEMLDGLTGT